MNDGWIFDLCVFLAGWLIGAYWAAWMCSPARPRDRRSPLPPPDTWVWRAPKKIGMKPRKWRL